MTKIFICALGPVQDFIASARTSQDLAFGSWMLSELAKAAAKALHDAGATLIFPAPEDPGADLTPGSLLNVANKIVALSEDNPKELASKTKEAVKRRLDELAQRGLSQIANTVERQRAEQQLEDLLEFYWASAVINDGYVQARTLAEAALAARKNTRDFQPWPGVSGSPKSSLDGFRESVLQGASQKETKSLTRGETLSGVDVVKRFGQRPEGVFPSTSDFAAAPFRQGLGELDSIILSELKNLLQHYTGETETDGAYYFVERLARFIQNEEKRDAFRLRYREIFQSHDVKGQASPYYALLVADGDFMGRAIDAQRSEKEHQHLSRKLSDFASRAKTIIKDYGGRAVYAGGDDILAYLPLHTALTCVAKLDEVFSQMMQDFAYRDEQGTSRLPTLSAGLAIVHHLTPLGDVMEAVRRAEREAKNHRDDKHELAILLQKRGGSETLAVDVLPTLVDRMQKLAEWWEEDAISHGAAHDLRDLAAFMRGTDLDIGIFAKEAVRILKRKKESGGQRDVASDVQDTLKRWLREEDVMSLTTEMIIASEFAKACRLTKISCKEHAL